MMGEREVQVAKDRLFNRIADSFVAMLFSIHPDMKDKFLNVSTKKLAQHESVIIKKNWQTGRKLCKSIVIHQ